MASATYLSDIVATDEGYLLFPGHEAQIDSKPLILHSVKQLWLKFHPHCHDIDFVENSETKRPPPSFADLIRFPDMANKICPVLEDINKMQDQERFIDAKQRDERKRNIRLAKARTAGKIMSLEREQDAYQSMKHGNTNGEQENSSHSVATLRVVKTMNSIRLVYPLLVRLLTHESRSDMQLTIGKCSISTDRSKGKQWMLGEYVFDYCSNKNFYQIRDLMTFVLEAILPTDEVNDVMSSSVEWKTLMPRSIFKFNIPESVPSPLQLLALNEEQLTKARDQDAMLKLYFQNETSQGDEFASAVRRLKKRLDSVLTGRFRGCRLEVYGSCLSDLTIGKTSDVDISIHIPFLKEAKDQFERGCMTATNYERTLKNHVFALQRRLADFRDFFNTQAVARARVPLVKGSYRFAKNPHTLDGSLNFDICFFNDIAVRNSLLLRDYTDVCPLSKNLIIAVKKWAKDHEICSAAEERLSSYAWTVLAIFYLQQIRMMPNLQCRKLMAKAGFEAGNDTLHRVNALDTAYVPWEQVKRMNAWEPHQELKDAPLSVLLYGFFHFLSMHFPYGLYAASIRTNAAIPKPAFRKCSLSFFCIEDPFETVDSHCPHDLGGPANVKGQREIMTCLAEAERQIRAVLMHGEGELWTRPESSNGSGNPDDEDEVKADLKQTKSENDLDDKPIPILANDQETTAATKKTKKMWNRRKGRHQNGTSRKEVKDGDKGEKIVGNHASNETLLHNKEKGSNERSTQKKADSLPKQSEGN